ncbi:MAG TPA: hypothetical protein VIA06_09905 [Candidatus Dormibacteraeota bacterium]|jgi:DNA-binding MarR family transcriptional regulator|nr:hypothetical protein [Candidatus Dormibacteraeota bacterium]
MSDVTVPVISGFDLNLAARATRSALDRVLEREGLTFPTWGVMNQIGSKGGRIPAEELTAALRAGLGMGPEALSGLLRAVAAEGLITVGEGSAELTAAGAERFRRLQALVADLAGELWAGFDPEELAVTRRVLVEVAERARAAATG